MAAKKDRLSFIVTPPARAAATLSVAKGAKVRLLKHDPEKRDLVFARIMRRFYVAEFRGPA